MFFINNFQAIESYEFTNQKSLYSNIQEVKKIRKNLIQSYKTKFFLRLENIQKLKERTTKILPL